jgi:hypothetical protein
MINPGWVHWTGLFPSDEEVELFGGVFKTSHTTKAASPGLSLGFAVNQWGEVRPLFLSEPEYSFFGLKR